MPVITGPLQADGVLIEAQFAWSATRAQQLRAALRPVPPSVQAKALLDTGAEITCLDTQLVQALGLPLGGLTLANLPAHGGLTGGALYQAALTIVHPSGNAVDNLITNDLSVLGLSLSALGYEAILGRDILAKCRFLYDGLGNRFELEY